MYLLLNHRLSQGVFCEDLDERWQTEGSWGGLMTESFNGGGTGITGDDNSLLFEWIYLQLKHRLSRWVFYEELDDCWWTEDSWSGIMTESFNGGGTCITGDDNSLIFELMSLLLEHRLSQWVFCEELDGSWQTEESGGGLMTELFNVGGTRITGD